MFVTALRSNDYDVVRAQPVFGERTDDQRLLEYCATEEHLLLTHDKKDFGGDVGDAVEHAGIVIDTDARFLRDEPGSAVETLDRVLAHYPPDALRGERVWLDGWCNTR